MHGGQRVTANSLRFPEVQSRAAPMAPQGDRCTHDATPLSDRQENQRTFWSQIAANLRSCGAKPSSLGHRPHQASKVAVSAHTTRCCFRRGSERVGEQARTTGLDDWRASRLALARLLLRHGEASVWRVGARTSAGRPKRNSRLWPGETPATRVKQEPAASRPALEARARLRHSQSRRSNAACA